MARSSPHPPDPNRWDPIPGETPIDDISGVGNESIIRGEYLSAIRAADAGDYATLIELHLGR